MIYQLKTQLSQPHILALQLAKHAQVSNIKHGKIEKQKLGQLLMTLTSPSIFNYLY